MLTSTSGIILKSIKYGDNSLIITIYTKLYGKLTFFVRINGKKIKNQKQILQSGFIVEIDFSYNQNKEFQHINNFSINEIYLSIPYNIVKSSIILVLSEILNLVLKSEHQDESLFYYISEAYKNLDNSEIDYVNFHLFFLLKLSDYLGFSPDRNYSETNCFFDIVNGKFINSKLNEFVLDQKYSKFINSILSANSLNNNILSLNNIERTILFQNIITYFSVHIENLSEIKSLKVLHDIFS